MSQVLLELSQELQERVNFWSQRDNKEPDEFLKNIIVEYLEDLEDYDEAARVYSEIQSGRMKTHSWEEVKKRLGMED